jgi:hypothetical protein
MESNLIIEGLKSEIDNGLSNIIGYNFLKNVFSNHQLIQKKRAEEFLSFVEENQQYFISTLINNECFVSGLALTLKTSIEQYSKIKRLKIYNIFLGFTKEEDKESFELEKMYFTLNLMSLGDLEIFQNFEEINEVFVPYGRENDKYSSLLAIGLIMNSSVRFDTIPYQTTSFGKKFKKYLAFQI